MLTDSRHDAEEELRKLRYQENLLIKQITENEGTMKDKIIALAQTMEKRIELLDCDYPISEISTQITRTLRQMDCPIADVVRRYLPEKYKNPELAKWGKLASLTQTMAEGGLDVRSPLEQCSIGELETYLEAKQQAKNNLDNAITQLNGDIDSIRREALRRGVKQLAGEKIRDQISARDYRYEIPDYFGLEELNKEVVLQGNRLIRAYNIFFNQKYPAYPHTIRQEAWKTANAVRTYANLIETVSEEKWSGEKEFWFDREYWKLVQSSHDAGNSTKFPTTLCKRCSENVVNDPKDFHRMKYWRPSPTGYICDNCGGTEIDERENTREQVGDKEPHVIRDAADVLNHLQYYPEICIEWRKRALNPAIYARKKAISEPFRKAAFGKEDLVVPRQKKKE